MKKIGDKFSQIGGNFLVPEDEIAKELSKINAFIFDWDGVFNNGTKGSERGSGFSEADAMGVNMLRFNYWRMLGKLPLVIIITGENNTAATDLAKREHFNAVYMRFLKKEQALQHIAKTYGTSYDEMAFVFDDVLDVDAASLCKLAFCVRRNSSPMFKEYIVEHKICHYITGHEGGNHAVREISELLMGLSGQYNETISKRIDFDGDYKQYLFQRNLIITGIETAKQ